VLSVAEVHPVTVGSAGTRVFVNLRSAEDTATTPDVTSAAVYLVTVNQRREITIITSLFVAESVTTSDDVISTQSFAAMHLVTIDSAGTGVITVSQLIVAVVESPTTSNDVISTQSVNSNWNKH
jgi:hypothetical protein